MDRKLTAFKVTLRVLPRFSHNPFPPPVNSLSYNKIPRAKGNFSHMLMLYVLLN